MVALLSYFFNWADGIDLVVSVVALGSGGVLTVLVGGIFNNRYLAIGQYGHATSSTVCHWCAFSSQAQCLE